MKVIDYTERKQKQKTLNFSDFETQRFFSLLGENWEVSSLGMFIFHTVIQNI